jgi:hypothetical protein
MTIRVDSAHSVRRPVADSHTGTVAIVSHGRAGFEPLADACRLADFSPTWLRRPFEIPQRFDAVIWDSRWGDDQEWDDIRAVVPLVAPARVIVIQGFPRWQDYERAREFGIGCLLGKPLQIPDLWRALLDVTSRSASAALPAKPSQPSNYSTTASSHDYNQQEGTARSPGRPIVSPKVY